jgi:hypothetical protein
VKRILFLFGLVFLMLGAQSALAQTQTCSIINGGDAGHGGGVRPTYLANQKGQANEGCTILITLNADGSISITAPNSSPSYDNGNDDNLIGVVNNTGGAVTSLQLSSATVTIFAFEDDVAAPRDGPLVLLGRSPIAQAQRTRTVTVRGESPSQ